MTLQLLLVYQFGHALGLAVGGVFMLNCDPKLYPRQWVELYFTDFLSGCISLGFMQSYKSEVDLSSPENLNEFNLIKEYLADSYNAKHIDELPQSD